MTTPSQLLALFGAINARLAATPWEYGSDKYRSKMVPARDVGFNSDDTDAFFAMQAVLERQYVSTHRPWVRVAICGNSYGDNSGQFVFYANKC